MCRGTAWRYPLASGTPWRQGSSALYGAVLAPDSGSWRDTAGWSGFSAAEALMVHGTARAGSSLVPARHYFCPIRGSNAAREMRVGRAYHYDRSSNICDQIRM